MQEPVRLILMYGLIPLWILAGLGDWWFHRRQRIEINAGVRESVMHSLMMVQVGVPVLLVLFFEVNALLFAIMIVAVVVHAVTAWVDVGYAVTRRTVPPNEQHMHSLLEMLPITAVVILAAAHWDQFLALFGAGAEPPRLTLTPKRDPLPSSYLIGLFAALGLFVVLPYAEELLRCLRAQAARAKPVAQHT
ncbi:hypothetical protein SAMN05216321_104219 [Cupriavidus sp. OV038]|jgi:hypothetical protein|uniref:diguanylate cyclase n=1 Tax=unclassified Cupriavidus TaxID=2640874 RepID=UPI0008F08546|nr:MULTISPECIES: diguanylate cyclase [unclassified Cupriavidus]SFC41883.1 hypothetical protein SAMN05216321_104219 [Cupriavidus sp. OV038]SFP31308.1 hypothetical protein SAMN05216322_105219 [Cupriavidus sp. OV096]